MGPGSLGCRVISGFLEDEALALGGGVRGILWERTGYLEV